MKFKEPNSIISVINSNIVIISNADRSFLW